MGKVGDSKASGERLCLPLRSWCRPEKTPQQRSAPPVSHCWNLGVQLSVGSSTQRGRQGAGHSGSCTSFFKTHLFIYLESSEGSPITFPQPQLAAVGPGWAGLNPGLPCG